VESVEFITSQKLLAKKVGCTSAHISNIKAKRKNVSRDLAKKIADEIGIEPIKLVTSRKASINKHFRKFFRDQRLAELAAEK